MFRWIQVRLSRKAAPLYTPNQRLAIFNLILKNQEMPQGEPYVHHERFFTLEEGQNTVDIIIYENDEEDSVIEVNGREPIMSAAFELGGTMPKNSPIDVTFSLNSDGILNILAVEPESGKEFPMQIETSGLTKEQIEKIKCTALKMNVE